MIHKGSKLSVRHMNSGLYAVVEDNNDGRVIAAYLHKKDAEIIAGIPTLYRAALHARKTLQVLSRESDAAKRSYQVLKSALEPLNQTRSSSH